MRGAAQRLSMAGRPSPLLDAQLWLGHICGLGRTAVLAHPEHRLDPLMARLFEEGVARLAAGEPLPYLTGHIEFYGLTFSVSPAALIPRPETEHLVDEAIRLANHVSPSAPGRSGVDIADIGTGSGCIAVALAKHLPTARVLAVDISPAALQLAACNAVTHAVSDRITFLEGNLLEPLPGAVDLLVANLPYVADGEWESLSISVRNHEPAMALRGGPQGLDLIEAFLHQAPASVRRGGAVLLEIGATQGPTARILAQGSFPDSHVLLKTDYAGRDRLIVVQTRRDP